MLISLRRKGSRSLSRTASYPPAPAGCVFYAVGDVHGRLDCLLDAQARIDRDLHTRTSGEKCVELYLGDFVDRGPDTFGVLEALIRRSHERRVLLLKGNHEYAMERFLSGELSFDSWKAFGGMETLLSYRIDPVALRAGGESVRTLLLQAMPPRHKRMLASAQPFYRLGEYCFVHAGIRPGVPMAEQTPADLASVREGFLDCDDDFGFIVIHGHTPVPHVDFRPNRINIDTGAYATNRLSVVCIDGSGARELA